MWLSTGGTEKLVAGEREGVACEDNNASSTVGALMNLDPLSPDASLSTARSLGTHSCPGWSGVGADSYRASLGEVASATQGIIDNIDEALSAAATLDAERAHTLALALTAVAEGAARGAW